MFRKFTQRARNAVIHAQEEARQMNHPAIGTEHILLGLLMEGEGIGARALLNLGLDLERFGKRSFRPSEKMKQASNSQPETCLSPPGPKKYLTCPLMRPECRESIMLVPNTCYWR
jgi:ATP-dependent Clp protease ATP-binding subunit ClpA